MPRIKPLILPLLCTMFMANSVSADDAVGLSIGVFNGIGLTYQKPLSDRIGVRLELTTAPFDSNFTQGGIEYDINYQKNNVGVLLEWQPAWDFFYLAGGIYAGEHNWQLKAKPHGNSWEIGDHTYISNNIRLRGEAAFAKSAPYLGLGFRVPVPAHNLTFKVDLGMLYIGKGALSYNAYGTFTDPLTSNQVSVANAQFQQDLENERAGLEKEIEDYSLLPMLHVGMAYRF